MVPSHYLILLISLASSGCQSKLDVQTVHGEQNATATCASTTNGAVGTKAGCGTFKITSLSKVVASPGETLTIKGEGFLDSMSVHLSGLGLAAADQTPTLKVLSPTEATVTLPSGAAFGPLALTASQDGNSQNLSIFSSGDKSDHPIFTADAGQICAGIQYYDVNGMLQTGTAACGASLPACTTDGASNCMATTIFKSADTSKVTPSNLLSGVVLAGITGNAILPSPENVLSGVTYGASGTTNIGTLAVPTSCTTDGQTGCITSSLLPAAAITGFSTWDLRLGRSIGGITGALKTSCRDNGNSTYFNYDGPVTGLPNTAVTTGTVTDYWDTVDDNYGWSTSIASGWTPATSCDSTTFKDVTTSDGGNTSSTCGTNNTCIYMDRISNLQFTGVLSAGASTTNTASPATFNWSAAVAACTASTYGGYAAGSWRLPTQKELMSLYEHGIVGLQSSGFATLANLQYYYWTASSLERSPSNGWYVYLASGLSSNYADDNNSFTAKTGTLYALCVK